MSKKKVVRRKHHPTKVPKGAYETPSGFRGSGKISPEEKLLRAIFAANPDILPKQNGGEK